MLGTVVGCKTPVSHACVQYMLSPVHGLMLWLPFMIIMMGIGLLIDCSHSITQYMMCWTNHSKHEATDIHADNSGGHVGVLPGDHQGNLHTACSQCCKQNNLRTYVLFSSVVALCTIP